MGLTGEEGGATGPKGFDTGHLIDRATRIWLQDGVAWATWCCLTRIRRYRGTSVHGKPYTLAQVIGKAYIYVVGFRRSHFPNRFLSLHFFESRMLCSLSSCMFFFSDGEWEERRRLAGQGWSETTPTRRLAVVDGGAAAPNVFFLFFFRSFSSTPFPLYLSNLKISDTLTQTPRSKKVWKEK